MQEAGRPAAEEIWRYAIERLDREDDVVRLETAPLAEQIGVDLFLGKLVNEESERLQWWDADGRERPVFSISQCKEVLLLDQQQQLAEGMVFWVVKAGGEVSRVIHATQAARKLASRMYTDLIAPGAEAEGTDKAGGASEAEQ